VSWGQTAEFSVSELEIDSLEESTCWQMEQLSRSPEELDEASTEREEIPREPVDDAGDGAPEVSEVEVEVIVVVVKKAIRGLMF